MRFARKAGVTMLILFGLALAYGYWVWPTPWRDWPLQRTVHSRNHIAHRTFWFRTNRLDGHVEEVLPSMFGLTDCYPMSMVDVRDRCGPLTAAQVRNAERRW